MKKRSGLSPKDEPQWCKYLNPIFPESSEDIELAAESTDVSYMDNLSKDPGNESYSKSEASDFSDHEGSSCSASLSSKSKFLQKKIRSEPVPSE